MSYFPEPHTHNKTKISNYAINSDLKTREVLLCPRALIA